LKDHAGNSELLRHIQAHSFGYFVHEVNRASGLVLDKTEADWPSSIAAVGMALTAYPVGVHRHFMSREEAVERTLTTLRFFAASEQSSAVGATGYKGFYYHFLHVGSGKRACQSELSSVDTAIFIAGALTAAAYFDAASEDEAEIRSLAKMLYERVEWDWMLQGQTTLCHGWRPESKAGFLEYRWEGYDEALILYLLALGSPTHGIGAECYAAWCTTYEWKTVYDIDYLYAGPLFIHQLSHVWVDFRGIRDAYMRDKGSGEDICQEGRKRAGPNHAPWTSFHLGVSAGVTQLGKGTNWRVLEGRRARVDSLHPLQATDDVGRVGSVFRDEI
jgi:hypothetical protein